MKTECSTCFYESKHEDPDCVICKRYNIDKQKSDICHGWSRKIPVETEIKISPPLAMPVNRSCAKCGKVPDDYVLLIDNTKENIYWCHECWLRELERIDKEREDK